LIARVETEYALAKSALEKIRAGGSG